MDDTARLLEWLLTRALLPLWLATGLADWACHRVQRIEATAGWRESLLHLLMLAEIGVGLMAVLWLEINAGVLALALAACVAHELTTWCDLAYAERRRRIPPFEQWVHSLQLTLPWAGWAALMLIHHQQGAALLGLGAAPDWALRLKAQPLPAGFVVAVLAAGALFNALPLVEEAVRGARAAAKRRN